MSSETDSPSKQARLSTIRRAARSAERRMRLGRVLAALPLVLTVALGVSAVAIALRKLLPWLVPEIWAWGAIGCSALAVIVTVI